MLPLVFDFGEGPVVSWNSILYVADTVPLLCPSVDNCLVVADLISGLFKNACS